MPRPRDARIASRRTTAPPPHVVIPSEDATGIRRTCLPQAGNLLLHLVGGARIAGAAPFGLQGCGVSISNMRNKLIRIYGQGHLHFVTFSCHRRQKRLGTARAQNLFVQVLGEVRSRYQFSLLGYVVMPEHVHVLISEPKKGNPSKAIQALKQTVSRRLRNKNGRKSTPNQLRLRFAAAEIHSRMWPGRFYDFNVWSHKKKTEKLQYMHFNPVKRGLVGDPRGWPWSSYSFYSGHGDGLLSVDSV